MNPPENSESTVLPLFDAGSARLHDFHLGDYVETLALQESVREARLSDAIPDTWLFGEHPAVITQGVRGQAEDVIGGIAGSPEIPIVKIDRGGMTTLHSPGQMILYPIVKLNGGSLAAGRMARALLETMRRWLEQTYGVASEIPKGRPGLYVEERKLMSVGISARQGVSMHGIAMNLSNDMSLWTRIVACGEAGARPISLSEILGRKVTPAEQRDSIQAWLRTEWGYRSVEFVEHPPPPSSP